VIFAAAVIAASLWGPARGLALTCSGATPKLCPHPLGPGGVCVPNDWDCCGTRVCAAACSTSWKRCLNAGTDFAVCEDTAAMCTPQAGGDPGRPKFCEELIMVTGSLTCEQPASLPGNIGWCCAGDELCGEHYPECICQTRCGDACCTADQVCVEGFCKPRCGPGMHYEGQTCVCDDDGAMCLGPQGQMCCPEGSICRGGGCVTPREPENPDGNFLQNMLNMIRQVGGAHGRSARLLHLRGAPAPGPVGAALLQLAAVNGLREAARRAFSDHPVDPVYQTNVVAPKPSLPTLVSGPGLDARAAAALEALLASQAKGFADALASAKSLARARGALSQGDDKQAAKQVRTAAKFAKRAARALRRVPRLRGKAVEALMEAGVAEVDTSTDEVLAFQASVESVGLPGDLAALLVGLGADADDLARVRDSLLVSSTGGPALIAPLADAAQTADLESIGLELRRFAKSARRSPFGPVAGAP